MLFPDKKSPLVRLSDAIKVGLAGCRDTSTAVLALYEEHRESFEKMRALAAQNVPLEELRDAAARIPEEVSWRGGELQVRLHSQVLTVLLNCCFCLEAYANTLAYYLFGEADYLRLTASGRTASTEALTRAFEEMSVRDKWHRLAALGPGGGFDVSSQPYQGFHVLFRFRDDMVHGKVSDLDEDLGPKRYGGRLPDPVTGLLAMEHAFFAAEVYWSMVLKLHEILGTNPEDFHRHYNLMPWRDESVRQELKAVADRYKACLG